MEQTRVNERCFLVSRRKLVITKDLLFVLAEVLEHLVLVADVLGELDLHTLDMFEEQAQEGVNFAPLPLETLDLFVFVADLGTADVSYEVVVLQIVV